MLNSENNGEATNVCRRYFCLVGTRIVFGILFTILLIIGEVFFYWLMDVYLVCTLRYSCLSFM